jgi:hypothetical protein
MNVGKKETKDTETGVLYIRYDKNTVAGTAIEKLKKISKAQSNSRCNFKSSQKINSKLNKRIVDLIVMHEGSEILNEGDIDSEELESIYWNCLNYCGGKIETTKFKLFSTQRKNHIDSFSLSQITNGSSGTEKLEEISG